MSRSFKIVCSILGIVGVLGCWGLNALGSDGGLDDSVPRSNPASASDADTGSSFVRVEMSWDEPADVDLELWDSEGKYPVTSAPEVTCDEIDGIAGSEYIDFRRYRDYDLSSGTYIVSVRFAEGAEVASSTRVTLIVTKPDGSVEKRTHKLLWEEGKNQWHAFSIDAATGEVKDIDKVVDTRARTVGLDSRLAGILSDQSPTQLSVRLGERRAFPEAVVDL